MPEQAECYHYLFEAALKLHQLGLDPTDPKHGPLTQTRSSATSAPASVSKGDKPKVINPDLPRFLSAMLQV